MRKNSCPSHPGCYQCELNVFGAVLPALQASQGWGPQMETGWARWCPGGSGCAIPALSLHGAQLRWEMEGNGRGEAVLQCFGGQSWPREARSRLVGRKRDNVTASAPASPCYGHHLALGTY